jgi:hypothetical protein
MNLVRKCNAWQKAKIKDPIKSSSTTVNLEDINLLFNSSIKL